MPMLCHHNECINVSHAHQFNNSISQETSSNTNVEVRRIPFLQNKGLITQPVRLSLEDLCWAKNQHK